MSNLGSNVVFVWNISGQTSRKNDQSEVGGHLSACASKHGKRFVTLLSNFNQPTRLIRVIEKMEGRCGTWVKEDIQVSNDVFKLLLVEGEGEEKIVSVGEAEEVFLSGKGVGGWTAETLQVERIKLQAMEPNVTRMFLDRTNTDILFLSKSNFSWKVQAIAAPKSSLTV